MVLRREMMLKVGVRMDNVKEWFGYDSLAFFGKVNASISHELKNVMAIISETTGLLGDLSEMARGGTPSTRICLPAPPKASSKKFSGGSPSSGR
jgi:hypothetical protein